MPIHRMILGSGYATALAAAERTRPPPNFEWLDSFGDKNPANSNVLFSGLTLLAGMRLANKLKADLQSSFKTSRSRR